MIHFRIISPSGAIDPSYIDGAEARLRSWGYQVSEGRYARGRFGRFSGTDEERLADLAAALQDPTVDYILCARGGYGLQRLLPKIISKGERKVNEGLTKRIIGFSDITVLHQWAILHGTESLHGLMCKHLTELPENSEMISAWRSAVEHRPLQYDLPAHPLNREGEVTGTLIGGNLSVLYGLQGTPYQLSALCASRPTILFIEDIAERHYHIDRMMHNLKMSGVLAHISGLIVGQFTDCEDDEGMGQTVYETIRDAVADYDYPVLFNFPAGHVERNMPIWLGRQATIKVTSQQTKFIQL